MATGTGTITISAPVTDVEFRTIITLLSDTFQSGGFTKTADTGQLTLASAVYPAANNTAAGYEIRQFTDTLAATHPIVMKIEYARGTNLNIVSIFITIGTGSNGSGTITGVIVASATYALNAGSLTSQPMYVSAGTNRFSFMLGFISGSVFGMERTVNASKVATSSGLTVLHKIYGSTFNSRYIPRTGSLPSIETSGGCILPLAQTSGQKVGGDVAVYPHYFFGIGEMAYPGTNFVGAFRSNFTSNISVVVSVLGANQTMMMLNNFSIGTIIRNDLPSGTDASCLMRYE